MRGTVTTVIGEAQYIVAKDPDDPDLAAVVAGYTDQAAAIDAQLAQAYLDTQTAQAVVDALLIAINAAIAAIDDCPDDMEELRDTLAAEIDSLEGDRDTAQSAVDAKQGEVDALTAVYDGIADEIA